MRVFQTKHFGRCAMLYLSAPHFLKRIGPPTNKLISGSPRQFWKKQGTKNALYGFMTTSLHLSQNTLRKSGPILSLLIFGTSLGQRMKSFEFVHGNQN